MRLLKLFLLTMLLSAVTAAAQPMSPPAGYVEVGDSQADSRMWFSPASVAVYTDYISVETFVISSGLYKVSPAARYVTNVTQFKPRENLRRETRITFHDADGRDISHVYNSPWRDMSAVSRSSLGWQLYEKVMKAVAAAGLEPRPVPFYLDEKLRLFDAKPGFSHTSFDPFTLTVADGQVAVDCILVYVSPYRGVKYITERMFLKPAEMSARAGSIVYYSETGEIVHTVPAMNEWRPISPGTASVLLLDEVTSYCREHKIELPR